LAAIYLPPTFSPLNSNLRKGLNLSSRFEKECKGKLRHPHFLSAMLHANMLTKDRERLTIYECQGCGFAHVGHLKKTHLKTQFENFETVDLCAESQPKSRRKKKFDPLWRIVPTDPLLLRIRRTRLRLRRAIATARHILSANSRPKIKESARQRVIDLRRHLAHLEAVAKEQSIEIPQEWALPGEP